MTFCSYYVLNDDFALQKCLFATRHDEDWLFRQTQRIAAALDEGEVALAQIHGLHIPLDDLDDQQLKRIAAVSALCKAGYDPDEPRIPKGDPHGGEWTTDGDSTTSNDDAGGRGGGHEPDSSNFPSPEPAATTPSGPSSPDAAGSGTGEAGQTQNPSMHYDWRSPAPAPSDNPPPREQAPANRDPSTFDSPDLGSDAQGNGTSAEADEAAERGNAASSQPDVDDLVPPEIPAQALNTPQQRKRGTARRRNLAGAGDHAFRQRPSTGPRGPGGA